VRRHAADAWQAFGASAVVAYFATGGGRARVARGCWILDKRLPMPAKTARILLGARCHADMSAECAALTASVYPGGSKVSHEVMSPAMAAQLHRATFGDYADCANCCAGRAAENALTASGESDHRQLTHFIDDSRRCTTPNLGTKMVIERFVKKGDGRYEVHWRRRTRT
jgi:hypothetical protein